MEKHVVAAICTNSHCKKRFWSCTSLRLGNASTLEMNTGWKSLRIFISMDLKRPLNWLKQEIAQIQERNCQTLSKRKCIQISYKKCLTRPIIGSVLHGEVSSMRWCELGCKKNVRWRKVSVIKCPLHRRFVMRVWPSFYLFLRRVSLIERCFI